MTTCPTPTPPAPQGVVRYHRRALTAIHRMRERSRCRVQNRSRCPARRAVEGHDRAIDSALLGAASRMLTDGVPPSAGRDAIGSGRPRGRTRLFEAREESDSTVQASRASPLTRSQSCHSEVTAGGIDASDVHSTMTPKMRLPKVLREPILGTTMLRSDPIRRDEAHDGFASICGALQRLLPSISRRYSTVSIYVEKAVAPTFTPQPRC